MGLFEFLFENNETSESDNTNRTPKKGPVDTKNPEPKARHGKTGEPLYDKMADPWEDEECGYV